MPFKGIKVLEMGQFIFIPYCGVHLADFGAEVIKVEDPAGGDTMRAAGAAHLPVIDFNYTFENNNRNKKSLAVDGNTEGGQAILHKLVEKADVFTTNFRARALKKMRMDWETVHKINPRLIYAWGTGWGLEGPDKDLGAFDYSAWAASGLMSTMGEDGSPKVQCEPGFGDHISAMTLAFAIASALYHREKTGEGQLISVSLWGSLLNAGGLSLHAAIATGKDVPRKTRKDTNNPLCNDYEAKDGKWFQIASKQSDRNWPDLCKAIGKPELEKDPRFNSHAIRGKNCKELISILDKAFATKTLDEWKETLKGYNVHWSPVRTYLEISNHPQALANGYVVEADHRQQGRIKVTGEPVYMSKTPAKIVAGTPELGEHTEEILLDMGYGWEDIANFKEKKAIL